MTSCLIIDDSKTIRDVLSKIFNNLFFETQTAQDGEDGLEKLNQKSFDLVVLDFNLPIVDGLDVLYKIRNTKNTHQPVVVFCTNIVDMNKIRDAIKAGANDYIIKPFDEEIIASKLKILGMI